MKSQAQARLRDVSIPVEPGSEHSSVSAQQKPALGVKLYADGRFPEALAILEEAPHGTEPQSSACWNDLGAAAFACGDAKRAEQGFRQALALSPDDNEVAVNLGLLLANLARPIEAIPLLQQAAAALQGPQYATITEILEVCRARAASDALAQSQAAFRELIAEAPTVQQEPPAVQQEPIDSYASEYWFSDITGWFSREEALHLYTAIKLARPRRILEIGTFYGRSTATICAAIKSARALARFITIDLDLRSEEQVLKTFGEIHGVREVAMPRECEEAFGIGLSTTAYARLQIEKHDLERLVNFETGDFRRVPGKFDFVFADVLHESNEIRQNLGAILAKIERGGILAAHDLSDENKKLIDSLAAKAEFISRSGTLGIYRIGGNGS